MPDSEFEVEADEIAVDGPTGLTDWVVAALHSAYEAVEFAVVAEFAFPVL